MQKALWMVFFPLLFVGCLADGGSDSRSTSGNKYTNAGIGLSLRFPPAWRLQLDQAYGDATMDLLAMGPAVDGLSPRVTVLIKPYSGNTDMHAILPVVGEELRARFTDLGDYQASVKTLDAKQYGEISYTTSFSGVAMEIKQDVIITNGKNVIITFADQASRFDQNRDLDSIGASLSF